MKEREELLGMGSYTPDDPLIKDIDRQILASQARDDTYKRSVTAPVYSR